VVIPIESNKCGFPRDHLDSGKTMSNQLFYQFFKSIKSVSPLFLTLIVVIFASNSTAIGQQYSSTPFQGFGSSGQWATTPPAGPDQPSANSADDEAMSPDSWGGSNGGNEFAPPTPGTFGAPQLEFSAPQVIPLDENGNELKIEPPKSTTSAVESPFQSAGFSKSSSSPVLETENRNGFPQTRFYPLEEIEEPIPHSALVGAQPGMQSHVPAPPNLSRGGIQPNVQIPSSVQAPGQFPIASGGFQPPMGFQGPGVVHGPAVNYRPDLGHRSPMPTYRHYGSRDNGQKFDFEDKKKEYPPMSEILATGRYFGSVGMLLLEPHFQANTAISITAPGVGSAQLFDFDLEQGPDLRLGFESKYGPGIELSYWQVGGNSDVATFTSDGTTVGETATYMLGRNSWSRLSASNPGETLTAVHTVDVEKFGVSFFKEVKLPISRINGTFGLQYLKISQALNASVNGGALGTLLSTSDIEAYGPQLTFEYYRPVGHTKIEFLTSFGASVLFGDRNQAVQNSVSGDVDNIQGNEFITTFNFFSGAQYKKNIAENRALFGRLGFTYSTWIGGGTANDPQGDFGLRGFAFTAGYNR
jgi:hypothetical protein